MGIVQGHLGSKNIVPIESLLVVCGFQSDFIVSKIVSLTTFELFDAVISI